MKGVKKAAKLGIRWKLITYFALFVAVILVLLWLFQTVFLDSFYKAIKTRNAQAWWGQYCRKTQPAEPGIISMSWPGRTTVRAGGQRRNAGTFIPADISPDCLIHHYGTFQLF